MCSTERKEEALAFDSRPVGDAMIGGEGRERYLVRRPGSSTRSESSTMTIARDKVYVRLVGASPPSLEVVRTAMPGGGAVKEAAGSNPKAAGARAGVRREGRMRHLDRSPKKGTDHDIP